MGGKIAIENVDKWKPGEKNICTWNGDIFTIKNKLSTNCSQKVENCSHCVNVDKTVDNPYFLLKTVVINDIFIHKMQIFGVFAGNICMDFSGGFEGEGDKT